MSHLVQWIRDLGHWLSALFHLIAESFTHYDEIVNLIHSIVATSLAIRANIETEVENIRNFQFNPHWKTRVINVPAAATQIQELKATLFDDFKTRLATVLEPAHELSLILHQEAAPDVQDAQGAVNAFSRATVKLGHIVTFMHQLDAALTEINNFVDLFRQLREQLEGLDALFLSQGTSKRVVDAHYRKRYVR